MKKCFECGAPAAHDHHVIPRSRGGGKTVPLCADCHGRVHDADMKRTDTFARMTADAQRGRYLAPRAPFGYRKTGERELVIVEDEAALVRELFKRRAEGENLMSLVRWLRSRGKEISRTGVRSILANRIYFGEQKLTWDRKTVVVKGNLPAILTEAEWEAAQARPAFSSRAHPRTPDVLLRGLVFCATCGSRCKVSKEPRFVCTAGDCSARASILVAELDAYVGAMHEEREVDRVVLHPVGGRQGVPADERAEIYFH